MRRPPPWSDIAKYPVAGGTILLAIGVTLASWSGQVDVTPLYETIAIRQGQLWRLLTSTLPHADILHLLFNVYWTWVFGTLVEEVFGHFRTFAIFVLLALVSNAAEYAFLGGGIGLSGIGYGLFGLLWVLTRRDRRFADAVDDRTIGLFIAWFFLCILITFAGYPIGNVAHGVGAATGALLGWTISARPRPRLVGSAALAALLAAALAGATVARPWINLSKDRGLDEGKLGYDDLMAGRNAAAARWLRDATVMRPRDATYWFDLGIAYQRLNRHADAEAAYKRAIELAPSNAQFREATDDRNSS